MGLGVRGYEFVNGRLTPDTSNQQLATVKQKTVKQKTNKNYV